MVLKKACYIVKGIAFLDLLPLFIITFCTLVSERHLNLLFVFRFLICFIFSILLFGRLKNKDIEIQENNDKKKTWYYFLFCSGIVLSVIQNYMLYEEMIGGRTSISCAIAAIAAYTLFDSAYRYYTQKTE